MTARDIRWFFNSDFCCASSVCTHTDRTKMSNDMGGQKFQASPVQTLMCENALRWLAGWLGAMMEDGNPPATPRTRVVHSIVKEKHRLAAVEVACMKGNISTSTALAQCYFVCSCVSNCRLWIHIWIFFSGQICYKNFKFIFNLCKWTETDTCFLTFHLFLLLLLLLLCSGFFLLLILHFHVIRVAAKCERCSIGIKFQELCS